MAYEKKRIKASFQPCVIVILLDYFKGFICPYVSLLEITKEYLSHVKMSIPLEESFRGSQRFYIEKQN